MKNILFFLILGLCLSTATPSHAILIPLTEAQMRAIVGQAGVSIEIEYIIFEQDIGEIAYTDDDGVDGREASAYIRDTHIRKVYKSIYTEDEFKSAFAEATKTTANPEGVTPMSPWKGFSPITIDVGACKLLTAIRDDSSDGTNPTTEPVVGIVAGLPTLMVNTTSEEFSVGVSMAGAINDNKDFIHVKTEGSAVFILGGTVEIAAR